MAGGEDCKGCMQLSESTSNLRLEMAEMKGEANARYAVIQEKMAGHVEDFNEAKMSIKECVGDLREGSDIMKSSQGAIQLQNRRLKEGEERFKAMEEAADEHNTGKKGPHALIEKAFNDHVNGDKGEHAQLNKSLSRITKLLAVLLAYLVLSGHGVKFLEFMVKLRSVWPA